MAETRKIAAILAADVVGFSRMASADEDRTLARLRSLRTELIDPTVASQNGRVFKRTGDGALVEFRSVVEAVRCAVTIQNAMIERNVGLLANQRIEFRIGIHLGDVVEESDGDLMGDGVNIAARLEGVAKPGTIYLSEQAYWQVKQRLDIKVSDLGLAQLKNIAEPIHVYSLEVGQPAQARPVTEAKPPQPQKRSRLALLAAGFAALLVVIAASGWWLVASNRPAIVTSPPAEAARLSLVVLPFANLSGDPAQDYFADGLTEDVISALGRFPDMTVISRSAAFAYKGKSARPDEIGRELNVAYLVDGSLRKSGDRVRISMELLETARATLLWTEQYDRDIKDLFTIQDEIARQIVATLSVRLTALQLARLTSKPPSNLEAYDLVLRGRDLSRRDSRAAQSQARQLFERAIELDQGYAPAYAGLGRLDVQAVEAGWRSDPDAALTQAEANGRKALSNDENVGAHILLGRIYIFRGDYDRALDELRRAVELNPSDPEAQSGLADALLWSGEGRD